MTHETQQGQRSRWFRLKVYLTDLAYALDAAPEEIAERRFAQIEQRLNSLEARSPT